MSSYVRNRLADSPTASEVEETQARLNMIELGWPNDTPAYGQFFTALHERLITNILRLHPPQ